MRTQEELVQVWRDAMVSGDPKTITELIVDEIITTAISELRDEIIMHLVLHPHRRQHHQQRIRPRNYWARSRRQ